LKYHRKYASKPPVFGGGIFAPLRNLYLCFNNLNLYKKMDARFGIDLETVAKLRFHPYFMGFSAKRYFGVKLAYSIFEYLRAFLNRFVHHCSRCS